jgi:hypothetical protein
MAAIRNSIFCSREWCEVLHRTRRARATEQPRQSRTFRLAAARRFQRLGNRIHRAPVGLFGIEQRGRRIHGRAPLHRIACGKMLEHGRECFGIAELGQRAESGSGSDDSASERIDH